MHKNGLGRNIICVAHGHCTSVTGVLTEPGRHGNLPAIARTAFVPSRKQVPFVCRCDAEPRRNVSKLFPS